MRWIFLLVMTGFSSVIFAQSEQGFIEFSVSDSVKIRPDTIVYMIVIQSMPDYEMGMDNAVDDYKLKETEERFIKICSKLNLHPTLDEDNAKYRINRVMSFEGKAIRYRLEFKSEAELEKLHQELKAVENIMARVLQSKVSPEREAIARQKLLAKIKAKANTEAQLLAKAFDKIAGPLISVNFRPDYDQNYALYSGIKPRDMYYDFGLGEEDLFFTLTQTINVKYALK